MALDAKTKAALNAFHKTQPALNIDGLPSTKRGILLGDLIDALMKDVEMLAAKLDVDTGVTDEDYHVIPDTNDVVPKLG